MASISYKSSSITYESVEVTISDLSSDFNSSNFKAVGVTDVSFANGATSLDGKNIGSKSAPSSGSARSVEFEVNGLDSGKNYTLYGYAQAKNGQYYSVSGSISFKTKSVPSVDKVTVSGNSVTIKFDDYDDYKYVNVMYRPEDGGSSTLKESGYVNLSTNSGNVKISDLWYSTDYIFSFQFSVDKKDLAGTVTSAGSFSVGALTISDADLLKGCTARWYNYAAGNTGKWNTTSPQFLISMGEYPFSSQYFMEAGICYTASGDFTKPNTNRPSPVKDNDDDPSIEGESSVRLGYTDSSLKNGGKLEFTAFLRTINGTYMPVPAVVPIKDSNEYEFYVYTKPSNVAYSTGYVPKKDEVVQLKADDINTFIGALNLVNAWFEDKADSGIDNVKSGEPIAAVTYGGDDNSDGFYQKLTAFKKYKNFTMTFKDVERGDDISAENMNALPVSINNMLGAI